MRRSPGGPGTPSRLRRAGRGTAGRSGGALTVRGAVLVLAHQEAAGGAPDRRTEETAPDGTRTPMTLLHVSTAGRDDDQPASQHNAECSHSVPLRDRLR